MFDEDDLLPISALQHLAFCERQCALMYIEGLWEENRFTAKGKEVHDHVHAASDETRGDCRVVHALPLRSLSLGLVGQADTLEFRRCDAAEGSQGVRLEGRAGLWRPFPVEHKVGAAKEEPCDEVQLCAQALCIEEMLQIEVPEGAIFYGRPRRRHGVVFDTALRIETQRLAGHLREFIGRGVTPQASYCWKCRDCSLLYSCLPARKGSPRSAAAWLAARLAAELELEEDDQ